MTPFELDCIRAESEAKIDAVYQDFYLDGLTDGAIGAKPQRNEEPYILGYAEGVRRTRDQGIGEIRWSSPYHEICLWLCRWHWQRHRWREQLRVLEIEYSIATGLRTTP